MGKGEELPCAGHSKVQLSDSDENSPSHTKTSANQRNTWYCSNLLYKEWQQQEAGGTERPCRSRQMSRCEENGETGLMKN